MGPGSLQYDLVLPLLVNQKPVRLKVTISSIDPISAQCMIFIAFGDLFPLDQNLEEIK